MAWSDAARRAAAEARRRNRRAIYSPPKRGDGVHVRRSQMAETLREARGTGLRGPGKSARAVEMATNTGKWAWNSPGQKPHKYFTNVKGAQYVDQGLGGFTWDKGAKRWKATPAQVRAIRRRNRAGMGK